MIKKIAVLLLFTSMLSLPEALAQAKIGYTNPAKVLGELPEVEEVNREIESILTERDQELAERAADLQQIFSEYETSMGNLTEQERASREQELIELNQQFEDDRQNILNEVQQKRNELMAPIIERMNIAIEEVAEEMELDLILNEGTSNGDAIIFFASSERLNVTNQIIEKLK